MSDASLPQRKKQWKKRRKKINTNMLQIVMQLEPCNLQGVLLGSAVWVCTDDATVGLLDALCFGNLDGGEGTAIHVRQLLSTLTQAPQAAPDGRGDAQDGLGQSGLQGPGGEHRQPGAEPADGVGKQREDCEGSQPLEADGMGIPAAAASPLQVPTAQPSQHDTEPVPQQPQQQLHTTPRATAEGETQEGPQHAKRARQGVAAGGGGRSKSVRLSLEEAFFMAYVLQVLQVYMPAGRRSGSSRSPGVAGGDKGVEGGPAVRLLDDQGLWQELQTARPDFLLQYLAYHHFRSKGWIPRTGLQYGADMVLYQKHPALMHSDFSVLILPRNLPQRSPPSWHDMQVLNRLTGQVSKKLLLLYVEEVGGPAGDYSSPNCLVRFAVQERVVRRWVPDSHRPA